jgi:hypothetical protein
MTDPNLPPVTPAPANQPPAAPAYRPPAAPAYQQPAPPAYGAQQPAPPAYGQQPYGQPTGPDKYNVLAIVSFVSSFFISLVAVITGHIALSQIGKTGEKGRGLAIAGLVLGYLGILTGIIILVVLIPLMIGIANNPDIVNR